MRKLMMVATLIPVWACASGPPIDPNAAPLPVYTEDEAPCEYEVIRRISAPSPPMSSSFDDFTRRVRLALGREALRVEGAEAVIANMDLTTGVARRREIRPGTPSATPPQVTGRAIRFIPGTCGAPLH